MVQCRGPGFGSYRWESVSKHQEWHHHWELLLTSNLYSLIVRRILIRFAWRSPSTPLITAFSLNVVATILWWRSHLDPRWSLIEDWRIARKYRAAWERYRVRDFIHNAIIVKLVYKCSVHGIRTRTCVHRFDLRECRWTEKVTVIDIRSTKVSSSLSSKISFSSPAHWTLRRTSLEWTGNFIRATSKWLFDSWWPSIHGPSRA